MKQEEKELLLKDLCARIPYGVKVATEYVINKPVTFKGISGDSSEYIIGGCFLTIDVLSFERWPCKPYLRPMSSMTEEESAELSNIISKWFDKEVFYLTEEPFLEYALSRINYSISPLLFDYLNSIHVDYRGLIPMGLALEAPDGMYK